MATKIKGICKGSFKYISQIFGNFYNLILKLLFVGRLLSEMWLSILGEIWLLAVVKERELEIGYPTDVKHVAHIGCDGLNGTAPSWV